MHTLLPCPALAGLAPVGAAPQDPEWTGTPEMVRTGSVWGFPVSTEAGEQGPVCVYMCVLHTPRSPPPFLQLYSSPAASLTSSPPNFNAFTQTNSSNLGETLFLGARGWGRWAGLQSPPALFLQPAGQGASLASAALSAGRAGMFTTSYRWPGCRLQ